MNKKSHILKITFFLCVLSVSNLAGAANWFVKGDGNANTTGGTTWATAVTLTKAAGSAAAGDVIYLSAGTYTQIASVSLSKAYTVVGGFLGTEDESGINITMSNPVANITKFTQAATSTVRIFAIGSSTLTGTITLQGVTFDGLNNNQNGQAIECSSSSTLTTVIKNCTFKNLAATNTAVSGALNVNNVSADVSITNCWFENIVSGNNGGAMSVNAKVGNTILISGCTFKNTATPVVSTVYNGGAIYANNAGYTLNIDNCNFESTKASTGGAIYTAASLTANISNCKFIKCSTANPTAGNGHGGAINFQAPIMNISNCTFDQCTDNGRGLIYWNAASTKSIIKKSIFTNNISQGSTQNSGAVFGIQNAISNVNIDSCYAYNNTSSANTSNLSASVLYSAAGKSNITVNHSAFVGNIGKSNVTRAFIFAAGTTTGDTISIQNSIVSNNTNLATNDTIRDVTSFSTLYGKVNYSNMLANGEYHSLVSNLASPATPLKTKYVNLLTSDDILSLTTPTIINDIVSTVTVLISKYNPTAGITQVSFNDNVFYKNGELIFNRPIDNVSVYSLMGKNILNSKAIQHISMNDFPKGIYLVNYTLCGKSMTFRFVR